MSQDGSDNEAPQKTVLTKEMISPGLSQIQKTADASSYAFAVLNLEEKEIDELGEELSHFEHLRDINLSKNKFENIDKLRVLKYLQVLEAKENQLTDN